MCNLLAIPKVCTSRAGIQSIVIFALDNVATSPTTAINATIDFVDEDEVYAIAFSRSTARFSEQTRESDHGDYYIQSLTAFVPKRRVEMETLKARVRNRRLHAIYIDRDGGQYIVWNARMFMQYNSGDAPGQRNGYTIEIKSQNTMEVPVISGNADLPETPSGPGGDGESCCITIEPVAVATPPTPSGNVENLNKIVQTDDGTKYFVDKNGLSIVLGRPAPKYIRIPTTPDGLLSYIDLPQGTLPDPADFPFPTYDVKTEISRRVFVKSSSRWLAYDPAPYLEGGFTIEILTGADPKDRIHFADPPRGAFIEIYIWEFPEKQVFPPLTGAPDPDN